MGKIDDACREVVSNVDGAVATQIAPTARASELFIKAFILLLQTTTTEYESLTRLYYISGRAIFHSIPAAR